MLPSSADTPGPRVFIIDDEWLIAETLETILNRNGFRAQAFHDANRALVRALVSPPDIVITDVMMPGMNGLELAIALRQACNSRILLFSGEVHAADLVRDARRRGFDFELMTKPLNPRQLLMRLQAPHHGHAAVDPAPIPADSDGDLPDAGSVPAA